MTRAGVLTESLKGLLRIFDQRESRPRLFSVQKSGILRSTSHDVGYLFALYDTPTVFYLTDNEVIDLIARNDCSLV
jgi:hypothetical protein